MSPDPIKMNANIYTMIPAVVIFSLTFFVTNGTINKAIATKFKKKPNKIKLI